MSAAGEPFVPTMADWRRHAASGCPDVLDGFLRRRAISPDVANWTGLSPVVVKGRPAVSVPCWRTSGALAGWQDRFCDAGEQRMRTVGKGCVFGVDQRETEADTIVLTEGMSDWLTLCHIWEQWAADGSVDVLTRMWPLGAPGAGTSAGVLRRALQTDQRAGMTPIRHVVIVTDGDAAGRAAAAAAVPCGVDVSLCALPEGTDLSDAHVADGDMTAGRLAGIVREPPMRVAVKALGDIDTSVWASFVRGVAADIGQENGVEESTAVGNDRAAARSPARRTPVRKRHHGGHKDRVQFTLDNVERVHCEKIRSVPVGSGAHENIKSSVWRAAKICADESIPLGDCGRLIAALSAAAQLSPCDKSTWSEDAIRAQFMKAGV